eukprot:541316-Prymnesium_polylepis.1
MYNPCPRSAEFGAVPPLPSSYDGRRNDHSLAYSMSLHDVDDASADTELHTDGVLDRGQLAAAGRATVG